MSAHERPELSSRLQKTTDDLKDLEHSVKTGMINVKVLMEFRNASERARQASAAVQQWLEAQGKGNDPYKLMAQVMGQRVEMATQLIREVTTDLESGDLEFDTPGLKELAQSVQTLAERMRRLFPQ
jgi:HAMP domain-containing protein